MAVSLGPDGLTLDNIVMPNNQSNSVVQVVHSGNFLDAQNGSSANWNNTNLSLSITPRFSDSKVLIILTQVGRLNGTSNFMRGSTRVMRNISGSDTVVWNTDAFVEMFQVRNATNEHNFSGAGTYLDSPGTTNQVTYRVQSYRHNDSGMNYFLFYATGRGSNMTLLEIAA